MSLALAAAGRLGEQRPVSGLFFIAAMGGLLFAWGAIRLPGWARARSRQFKELIGRLQSSTKG